MLGLFALPLFAGDHKQDGRCRDDHRTATVYKVVPMPPVWGIWVLAKLT